MGGDELPGAALDRPRASSPVQLPLPDPAGTDGCDGPVARAQPPCARARGGRHHQLLRKGREGHPRAVSRGGAPAARVPDAGAPSQGVGAIDHDGGGARPRGRRALRALLPRVHALPQDAAPPPEGAVQRKAPREDARVRVADRGGSGADPLPRRRHRGDADAGRGGLGDGGRRSLHHLPPPGLRADVPVSRAGVCAVPPRAPPGPAAVRVAAAGREGGREPRLGRGDRWHGDHPGG
mmetsp:Transcript_5972/g.14555  ORF Transcript_5972/g.14555 Transcript_5972/m.14555 type:complete len:237 (-) Transcript_5972:187-897(-)